MINKDELLFTVDENNNPIEPQLRHIVHQGIIWHRTCHVWVVNKKGQILCQKRSLLKDMAPGKWEAFFGGHIPPNESYLNHAITEVKEELGINISPDNIKQIIVFKETRAYEFQAVYIFHWDGDIKSLKIEPEEVDKVEWIDKDIVRQNIVMENWTNSGYINEIFNHI